MPKFARFAAILMATAPVLAGTPAHAQPAAPQQAPASAADLQLRALYNGYSEWAAKEGGYFETEEGEQKQSDYLPRVDASTQQQQAAHLQGLLNQLNAIPANQLSPSEQVNAAVFRTVLENSLIEAKYRTFEMPFNSDSSFWTYLDENQQLRDADEYRRYIARMRQIPRYFDEQIVNMRAGIARGFTVPKATLTGRDKSIEAFIAPTPQKTPFYKAFETMPSTIPAGEQAQLRKEGAAAIADAVMPAYDKLLSFYRTEYY